MASRKSRLSKIMAVVLLFMMVFSFNTAFGQQVMQGNEQGGNPGGGNSGSIMTTDSNGVEQNANVNYEAIGDVYVKGEKFVPGTDLFVMVEALAGADLSWVSLTANLHVGDNGSIPLTKLVNLVPFAAGYSEYRVSVDTNNNFRGAKSDNFKVRPNLGSIEVVKQASDGKAEGYQNVTFVLSDGGLENNLTATTNAAGIAIFPNLIPNIYTLTETVVPVGYITTLDNSNNKITVAPGQKTSVPILNVKTPNVPTDGNIKVVKTKIDEVNGSATPQSGITFTLSKIGMADKTAITEIVGSSATAIFSNLEPGTYTLSETVPAGYTTNLSSTNNQITVVVGETKIVPVINTKTPNAPTVGNIKVVKTKIDEVNGAATPQSGITFTLSKNGMADKTAITEIVEGSATAIFSNLEAGTYTLSETIPAGYTTDLSNANNQIIVVTGETVTVSVKNTKDIVPPPEDDKGTLEILKTNSQGTPQSGIEFKLYTGVQGDGGITYTDYDEVVTKTDNAGRLRFSGLDLSKSYFLSEVIPSGFSSNLREYTKVTFGEDNKATIQVVNTRNDDDGDDEDNGDDGDDGNNDDEPITPDEEDDVTTPGNNDNPTPPSDNHEQPTPPEPQPVTPPEEPKVSAPAPKPSPELPYTGGNTMGYLLTGSALTGLGVLLRRFKR